MNYPHGRSPATGMLKFFLEKTPLYEKELASQSRKWVFEPQSVSSNVYTLQDSRAYTNTLPNVTPYLYTLPNYTPFQNIAELHPISITYRSIPYLKTLSRTIPYLDTLSRTIPYPNKRPNYLSTWH